MHVMADLSSEKLTMNRQNHRNIVKFRFNRQVEAVGSREGTKHETAPEQLSFYSPRNHQGNAIMEPEIVELESKKLVGMRMEMSLSENRTSELWRAFMPRRAEVENRINDEFYSLQNYGENWDFSPDKRFEKWALVEVASFENIPGGMEEYRLEGGTYAVFTHLGPAAEAQKTFHYIFGEWLPTSGYAVDNREQFEVLPAGYNPLDPHAKEEIWVPVKDRAGDTSVLA